MVILNGKIVPVTNLSRDWARAVVDRLVPAGDNVYRVNTIRNLVGVAAYQDSENHRMLLDPPTVTGVEGVGVDKIEVPPGGRDVARQAVRPSTAGPGRVGMRERGQTCPDRPGRRTAERVRLMLRRVRISTSVLMALFSVTPDTYLLVHPTTTSTGGTQSGMATVEPPTTSANSIPSTTRSGTPRTRRTFTPTPVLPRKSISATPTAPPGSTASPAPTTGSGTTLSSSLTATSP